MTEDITMTRPNFAATEQVAARGSDPTSTGDTTGAGYRAVTYLRVSTMGQVNTDYDADGFSINAQRDACRKKAESLGAVVVDEYVDKGESARKADRPELQRMLLRLGEERDVDYVITFKVDRIARNREDDVAINLAIRHAGARLVSVSENIDDTPSGKLLHAVMAGVAEFYSANLSHEVSKKMVEKAKKGGTLTRAPVGYMNVRDHVDGKEIRTVAVDPDRGPLVAWALKAYATGDYTVTQLHQELVERGMTTRSGAKAGKPIGRSQIAKMLTNRYYLGIITYQGIEYPGRHEPLTDPVTWAKVQAVLAANRQGEKQRQHPHYLKSTIVCGRCGSRLCYGKSRGSKGDYYEYFFCLARQQKRNNCDLPYLPAYEVEDAVAAHYSHIRLPAAEAHRLRQLVHDALDNRSDHARAEQQRQDRRIAQLERERDKLLQLHYADALPIDKIASEQRRITRQMDEALAASAAASIESDTILGNLDRALREISDPQTAYRNSGPRGRRHWNQTFFRHIAIDTEGVTHAQISDPYAALLARDLVGRLEQELKNPDPHCAGRGSKELAMVAGAGFEPATFGL